MRIRVQYVGSYRPGLSLRELAASERRWSRSRQAVGTVGIAGDRWLSTAPHRITRSPPYSLREKGVHSISPAARPRCPPVSHPLLPPTLLAWPRVCGVSECVPVCACVFVVVYLPRKGVLKGRGAFPCIRSTGGVGVGKDTAACGDCPSMSRYRISLRTTVIPLISLVPLSYSQHTGRAQLPRLSDFRDQVAGTLRMPRCSVNRAL